MPKLITSNMCCTYCMEILPLNPDYTLDMDEVEQVDGMEWMGQTDNPYPLRYVHNGCVKVDGFAEEMRHVLEVEHTVRGTKHLRRPQKIHRSPSRRTGRDTT